jgi:hypothetical protein
MNKIKKPLLMLVIANISFFLNNNVFAVDVPAAQVGNMTKAEYLAYKQAKGEEQRALALSNRPEVVGDDILEQEADGRFTLSQEALDNWANGRMFPAAINKK